MDWIYKKNFKTFSMAYCFAFIFQTKVDFEKLWHYSDKKSLFKTFQLQVQNFWKLTIKIMLCLIIVMLEIKMALTAKIKIIISFDFLIKINNRYSYF